MEHQVPAWADTTLKPSDYEACDVLVLPEDAGMIALVAGNAVLCVVTAVVSGACALGETCSPGWWTFSNAVTLLFGWLVRDAAQPPPGRHAARSAASLRNVTDHL